MRDDAGRTGHAGKHVAAPVCMKQAGLIFPDAGIFRCI
jgi:hypothetical protein